MNTQQKKAGFTIIEVVLVLAIVGLIFVMIFVALPALQRNQRDGDRKAEVARVISAVTSFRSNSNNNDPTITSAFAGYLDATFTAAGGGSPATITLKSKYTLRTQAAAGSVDQTTNASQDLIILQFGTKCGASGALTSPGTTKQMAVTVLLENGNGAGYCQDS